jgi:DNA-binding MarR family transcriptional regulator
VISLKKCADAQSENARSCVTFPSVDEEALAAWRAVLNVHALVTSRVESALAAAALPPLTWYDVLWPLYRAPGRRLRMGALVSRATLSRTGLTRLVDRIEAAGLLQREPAPEDRRGAYVVLTPAGTRMLRRMWPVYEGALEETFGARLRSAATVRRALEAVAAGEERPPPRGR